MGREERAQREARAKCTVHRALPELLRMSPKARHGVSRSERIVDPSPQAKTPTSTIASEVYRPDLKIRVIQDDCLTVAAAISEKHYGPDRSADAPRAREDVPNVAIHNMGSAHAKAGGFLTGANGQEEFICARSTAWAALCEAFYPLPASGGIFSPDVLVFRDKYAIDLAKRHRYFVDLITAGLWKHPNPKSHHDGYEALCSCAMSYCDEHRNQLSQKMKAVLRIAQSKGTRRLILGAWGVGVSHHPVEHVAKLWRKVIVGGQRQRRPNVEQWEGIDEIIFAMPDSSHRKVFERIFDDVLSYEPLERTDSGMGAYGEGEHIEWLVQKAQNLELRIEEVRGNSFVRRRLKDELNALNHEIALGRAARASKTDDDDDNDDNVEDSFVVAGYAASDGEDVSFYPIGHTTTSDSADSAASDEARSETYEFHCSAGSALAGVSSDWTADEEDGDLDGQPWVDFFAASTSPQFDAATGWFTGSIDELHDHLTRNPRGKMSSYSSISPPSPLVRQASSSISHPPDHGDIHGILSRFRRTDVVDQSE